MTRAKEPPHSPNSRSLPTKLLIGLMYSVLPFCAGVSVAAGQTFSFQVFGQSEGLTDLGVGTMAAGADGNFWVGTQNGLFLFNGSHFTRVPSVNPGESPLITATYIDDRRRLWFTDAEGIYLHDATGTRRISREDLRFGYQTPPQIVSLAGEPDAVYFSGGGAVREALSRDDGSTWRVREVFTPAEKSAQPELRDIHGLTVKNGQELWMGCGDALCELTQGRLRVWSVKDGVQHGFWSELFVDHAGKLWIRGSGHVFSLAPGAQRFERDEAGLAPHALDAGTGMFVEDHGGRVITGIVNGIAVHDGRGWHTITTRNGLPAQVVSSLCVDRDGTLWMALTGLGLVRRLGSANWEGWTSNDGLTSNNIWAIARDRRGWLWAGTESALDVLQPGSSRFEPVSAIGGKSTTHVLTLWPAQDGRIWLGSGSGDLIVYDPQRKRGQLVDSLTSIFHLFADRKGRIWICTGNGVWSVDSRAQAERPPVTRASGITEHNQIFDGAEDPSGALWFVGSRALFRWDGHTWSDVGLPARLHLAIFGQLAIAADGTLWVTVVNQGLVHLRFNGVRLQPISEPAEMASASGDVVMLHIDSRGWVWAGTDDGVDVFNGQRWIHVTRQDGLLWDDIDTNAFFSDRDGSVWIGTSGGIAHVLQPEDLFADNRLRVVLSQARLGAQTVPPDGNRAFPWRNQPFTLRLSVSDFSRIHAVEYQYRLADLETDWTRTEEADVRYPSLPPGDYRFEVFAVDLNRGTRTPDVFLSFRILAPWWQRWWFYALAILALCGLVVELWRWRHRMLLQRQQHLELLVQERTRELTELALHDSLTGLLNRAAIFEVLEKEIERAHRSDGLLAIVLADLDHFKEVNDRYGHPVGDAVLAAFARRVRMFLRNYDGLGRYGGEEFLILIPGIERDRLVERVEALRKAIATDPFEVHDLALRITCSFGITMLSPGDHSSTRLIERADAALYVAKREGRNRLSCEQGSLDGSANG
ncbi:MAG TPA: diguanylate cyclase [Acidobacteriaceae bacterium]|nr:diguanylate cyclase [Acidobacteriaceae bacterium]